MAKNIEELLEENEKYNKENERLDKKLQKAKEYINSFKTGDIDALVVANEESLKIYTEETADKTYRLLIEKMNEGAVTLDNDGTIIYCNSSFANMVNLPLQKVIGTFFKNFIESSSKDHFEDLLIQSKTGIIKEEVSIRTNEDKLIPVLMSINTFLLDDNFVLSIILTDLTIQNQNQQELKRGAMELIQKNIELNTVNKELAFQNKEKEKRADELNIANEELVFQNEEKEKRAAELIISNKELAFQNGEKEKRAAELIIANKELAFQNEEKEKRAGELNIANKELLEKARQLERQDKKMMQINDELKLLNQHLEKRVFERTRELESLNYELKDLNLSKDKFLSVISHDLRNPLTALLLSSEELSLNTENPVFKNVRPFIKTIHKTSHNILQQLNDVVEWAKNQREKTSLMPEKIHLVFNVDHSLELLKTNALQKKITIENQVRYDIYVKADVLMLRSIFQNLITNSIKYTPPGGLITITAQSVDNMIEISVTDTGIGMEPGIRDHLFTNSHPTSLRGTDQEKGSGLGLLLVKDFVTQQQGSIWAESELGKGTSIIFTIPEY